MHMACHICDSIVDYGPLTAFWAFSFERYNGTLESMNISWCGPENQLMKKFISLQTLNLIQESYNDDFDEFYNHVYVHTIKPVTEFSSVEQMSFDTVFLVKHCQYYSCEVHHIDARDKPYYKLLSPLREKCLSDTRIQYLRDVYKVLYPNCNVVWIARFYHESKKILINGEEFITDQSRSKRSSAIIAHWLGVTNIDKQGEAPVRVGIPFFIRHSAVIRDESGNETTINHILAEVQWLQDHPKRQHLHTPVIISATVYDVEGPATYIPVSRIIARCAIARDISYHFDYGEDKVCICVPLNKTYIV